MATESQLPGFFLGISLPPYFRSPSRSTGPLSGVLWMLFCATDEGSEYFIRVSWRRRLVQLVHVRYRWAQSALRELTRYASLDHGSNMEQISPIHYFSLPISYRPPPQFCRSQMTSLAVPASGLAEQRGCSSIGGGKSRGKEIDIAAAIQRKVHGRPARGGIPGG